MSLVKALPLLCMLSIATAGAPPRGAASSPRGVDVTGVYTSNWGPVRLVQEGTRVRGIYVCCGGGTIEGRIIDGRVLRYHWHEPDGAGDGEGVWTIRPGRLDGTWGHGQSTDDGGPWTLVIERDQIAQ